MRTEPVFAILHDMIGAKEVRNVWEVLLYGLCYGLFLVSDYYNIAVRSAQLWALPFQQIPERVMSRTEFPFMDHVCQRYDESGSEFCLSEDKDWKVEITQCESGIVRHLLDWEARNREDLLEGSKDIWMKHDDGQVLVFKIVDDVSYEWVVKGLIM